MEVNLNTSCASNTNSFSESKGLLSPGTVSTLSHTTSQYILLPTELPSNDQSKENTNSDVSYHSIELCHFLRPKTSSPYHFEGENYPIKIENIEDRFRRKIKFIYENYNDLIAELVDDGAKYTQSSSDQMLTVLSRLQSNRINWHFYLQPFKDVVLVDINTGGLTLEFFEDKFTRLLLRILDNARPQILHKSIGRVERQEASDDDDAVSLLLNALRNYKKLQK